MIKVIVIIVCIIAALIFLLTLLVDLIGWLDYKHATIYHGKVIRCLGAIKQDTYGSGLSHQQRRSYGKYLVEYEYKDGLREDEVLTKSTKLTVGDSIDVHILDTDDGKHIVASDTHGARLFELLIAVIFGVILSVFIIYYKSSN